MPLRHIGLVMIHGGVVVCFAERKECVLCRFVVVVGVHFGRVVVELVVVRFVVGRGRVVRFVGCV